MSTDFTSLSRSALEANAAGLTQAQLIKIASDDAVRRIAEHQHDQHAKVSRTKLSRDLVFVQLDRLVKVSKAVALYEAGALPLEDDAVALLSDEWAKCSEAAEALGDAVAEGDSAEQQLIAGLIEAASVDPAAAEQIIAEVAGDEMDEEEILGAAQDLVEVDEAPETVEGEKTSSAAYARLTKVSAHCSEFAGAVITRMAQHIQAELYAQG